MKLNSPSIECEMVIIKMQKRMNPFWLDDNTFEMPFYSCSFCLSWFSFMVYRKFYIFNQFFGWDKIYFSSVCHATFMCFTIIIIIREMFMHLDQHCGTMSPSSLIPLSWTYVQHLFVAFRYVIWTNMHMMKIESKANKCFREKEIEMESNQKWMVKMLNHIYLHRAFSHHWIGTLPHLETNLSIFYIGTNRSQAKIGRNKLVIA